VQSNSFQSSYGGLQDGCVFKLSADCTQLLWSTYLGGSGDDGAFSLKVMSNGEVVTVGGTSSANFPVTAGVVGPVFNNQFDGFLTHLTSDGTAMVKSTFINTGGTDCVYFVELDSNEEVYVFGQSDGGFPVSASVYSQAGGQQFIAKLNSSFSAYDFSTVFCNAYLAPSAFLVDVCSNIYAGGFTSGISLPVTADAMQPSPAGSGDFYFIVLDPNAAGLHYATYFGGSGWEHVDGGTSRYDKQGVLYQSSCTNSANFPTTPNAVAPTSSNGPSWDIVCFKIDFESSAVVADAGVANGNLVGCIPFAVDFENSSTNAITYLWDFGDGTTSADEEPVHIYSDTGTYTVTLIAINSGSCSGDDTTTLLITAHNDSVVAAFDQLEAGNCDTLQVEFTNLSQGGTSYDWDFGDGNTSSIENPYHTYIIPGSYDVTLIVFDPARCNPYDTITQTVDFYLTEPEADFEPSAEVSLAGTTTDFLNLTEDGDFYFWDFGDGNTSDLEHPSHVYAEEGEYTVCLVTTTNAGCIDSICKLILVQNLPAVDVPNAFSPDNDGLNDVLYVRGHGVANLHFRVFDRWGHLVFETLDISQGWDGRNDGSLGEMDVYVYHLNATFENGATVEKKGNVTLVR
jgi:gliding motility-associated-like protein